MVRNPKLPGTLEHRGGISSVKVPTDPQQDPKQCTDWTTVDDPPEVIAAISDRLKKHFGQSKDCTWTSPPLDFTMHFEGAGDIADAILAGTYDTEAERVASPAGL